MIEVIEWDTDTMGLIDKPGFFHMNAETYHADPCVDPSLSNSICKVLASQTAFKARYLHPRLNPNFVEDEASNVMDFGSAVHKLALGRGAEIDFLDFDDYKKGAAREARDNARAQSQIPLLLHRKEEAETVAKGLREATERLFQCEISDLLTELVVVAKHQGVWYRIMVDVASPDLSQIADIKTTEVTVSPAGVEKQIYNREYECQEVFYQKVLGFMDPENVGRREFHFIFGEASPPYEVGAPQYIGEAGRTLGRESVDRGIRRWKECTTSGLWSSYDQRPREAQPPAYKLHKLTNEFD